MTKLLPKILPNQLQLLTRLGDTRKFRLGTDFIDFNNLVHLGLIRPSRTDERTTSSNSPYHQSPGAKATTRSCLWPTTHRPYISRVVPIQHNRSPHRHQHRHHRHLEDARKVPRGEKPSDKRARLKLLRDLVQL